MNPFNAKARFRLRVVCSIRGKDQWNQWKRMTGENGHMCENDIAMTAAKKVIIVIWTPKKIQLV